MNINEMADTLNLSGVSRALICTCGSGVPDEEEHVIASLVGLTLKKLQEFPRCELNIETDCEGGRITVNDGHRALFALRSYTTQEEMLDRLVEAYRYFKEWEM